MATKKRTSKKQPSKRVRVHQPPDSENTPSIKLEFYLPPDVPVHYVDNINVIHTASEFTISFMQAQPPLLTRDMEWEKIKAIPSKCVARIIVSPMKMELMVRTLASNFQTYVQNYIPQETDSGNDDTKTSGDTAG